MKPTIMSLPALKTVLILLAQLNVLTCQRIELLKYAMVEIQQTWWTDTIVYESTPSEIMCAARASHMDRKSYAYDLVSKRCELGTVDKTIPIPVGDGMKLIKSRGYPGI